MSITKSATTRDVVTQRSGVTDPLTTFDPITQDAEAPVSPGRQLRRTSNCTPFVAAILRRDEERSFTKDNKEKE